MGPRLLLVDDDETLLRAARRRLGKERVVTARTAPEAARFIRTWMWWNGMTIDMHLADGGTPEAPNAAGMPLVSLARERYPRVPIAINTGYDRATLRKEAAAHDADYVLKGRDDARLLELYRRWMVTCTERPPLPAVITSQEQLRDALVHWAAHTSVWLELGFEHGQVLFVEAEALAKYGRLLTREEEAAALGITPKAVTMRRAKILREAGLVGIEELFERVCGHAGLEHCFDTSPERMRRISGTVPVAARDQNPVAPRAAGDGEGDG